MRHLILFIALIAVIMATVFAQQEKQALTIRYNTFALSYQNQPQAGTVALPMIEGSSIKGAKEQFGILLKSAQGKNIFAEIKDASGKILSTLTVDDYLGKSTAGNSSLVSNSRTGLIAETIHEIKTVVGPLKLITKALLAGERNDPNSPEKIIVTFSLSSSSPQNVSLRLLLPFVGAAEGKGNGCIISGKSAGSIAASLLPSNGKVEVQKNVLALTSPVTSIADETPVIWLSVVGAAGKSEAEGHIANEAKASADPNIVVINSNNKTSAQPGDTVTYTLICKNIGMGDATNIQLSNPVPAGTTYVEGTATERGTELSFEKETVQAPQIGAVKAIHWKLNSALKAGQEQKVSFKVVIH